MRTHVEEREDSRIISSLQEDAMIIVTRLRARFVSATLPILVPALLAGLAPADVWSQTTSYRGSAPAITDAVGGHVEMRFAGVSSLVIHFKSGRIAKYTKVIQTAGIRLE